MDVLGRCLRESGRPMKCSNFLQLPADCAVAFTVTRILEPVRPKNYCMSGSVLWHQQSGPFDRSALNAHIPDGLGVAKGAQAAVLPLVQVASRYRYTRVVGGDRSGTSGVRPPNASVVNGVSSRALIRMLNPSTAGIAAGAGRYGRWPCVLVGQAIRKRARKPLPRGSVPARSMNARSASGCTMTPKVNRRSRTRYDDLLRRSTSIEPPSHSTLSSARLRRMWPARYVCHHRYSCGE